MKIVNTKEFKEEIILKVLNRGKTDLYSISSSVKTIVDCVKEIGDEALLKYTQEFDKVKLLISKIKVTNTEIKAAYNKLEKTQISALKKAATNIKKFHERQLKTKWSMNLARGVNLGQVVRPLGSVGIYAPRGQVSYPSSVLMCAIPAKLAGVKRVVVCSPPLDSGDVSPALLVASDIAKVNEIYRVGGAQAIAAMAYGTNTLQKVDKIIGPGNIFVTKAKLYVNRDVSIDLPAGPSEILIIADETGDASFISSDLLAQLEHDSNSWAILLTTSKKLASEVRAKINQQKQFLSRKKIINASLKKGGIIVIVNNLEEAIQLTNIVAPEHLEIQTKTPKKILNKIQNAGACFLGKYSPVAFGDYSSGLNHVLPTAGYAKFYSGLSTLDFIKTINFLNCSKDGYKNLKKTAISIAKMEGFDAHEKSVLIREEKKE
jgi:histidinol dehydrogenase